MTTVLPETAVVNKRAKGLDRAFDILEYLRERGEALRPNEIAIGIGSPRSTVYELVAQLIKLGALDPADDEGRVFLGRRLYFMGLAYASRFDLMRECEVYLNRLAEQTRETAQLCLLDGRRYAVAMMKEGARPFRISANVGEAIPLPWTASGRLLLGHLSDSEILAFIPPDDFVLPDGRRLPTELFLSEVHGARARGYFTFDSLADSFTHCFAAPVCQADGRCIATLCLVAPKEDAARNHAAYVEALVTAAADLSSRLGGDQRRR